MKQVCRFQSNDGQEFDDRDECRRHEIACETIDDIVKVLQPSYNTGRAESVISSMVNNNAKEIRDLLNRHLRRQPQAKNVDVFPDN